MASVWESGVGERLGLIRNTMWRCRTGQTENESRQYRHRQAHRQSVTASTCPPWPRSTDEGELPWTDRSDAQAGTVRPFKPASQLRPIFPRPGSPSNLSRSAVSLAAAVRPILLRVAELDRSPGVPRPPQDTRARLTTASPSGVASGDH